MKVDDWIPEIGTTCEVLNMKTNHWLTVKITGVGEEGVILRMPGTTHEHYMRFEGRQFRPIRTDREKGIEAMLDLLNAGTQLSLADAIEQLYDAGYRKV